MSNLHRLCLQGRARLKLYCWPCEILQARFAKGALNSGKHSGAKAQQLEQRLMAARLPVLQRVSHCVPVMVGNPVHCKALADGLLKRYGVCVQPISDPPAPRLPCATAASQPARLHNARQKRLGPLFLRLRKHLLGRAFLMHHTLV